MRLYYEDFADKSITDFERSNLKIKYPDYKYLVNEYREGMMLFEMMRMYVWEKGIQDTTECRNYFNQNREKYKWGQRATAAIYQVNNEATLNQLKPYLLKDIYPFYAIELENLYFDKDESSLNENSLTTLNKIVEILKKDPNLRLEIEGHADPSEKNNLSKERLDPTAKYLIFKKIDPARLIIKDFGFTKPVSRTDRNKNRRIEFKLYSVSKKVLEIIFNETDPLTLKITEGVFEKGENEHLDKVEWKPGTYTLEKNGQIFYIEIKDIKEPRLKEFDEARGYAITDYQKHLEDLWIEELRKKYPVQINQEEVEKLYRK